MKTKWILLLTLAVALPFTAMADNRYKKEKVTEWKEKVNRGDILKATNVMGELVIVPTSANEITAKVVIKTTAPKEALAEEMLTDYTVEFVKNGNMVHYNATQKRVRTNNRNASIELDVTFEVPAYMMLDVRNSFGSIRIPDMQGNVNATASHGNLTAGRLQGEKNSLKSSFGSIACAGGGNLTLDASHGNINLTGKAGVVEAKTTFGYMKIGDAETVKANASHGHFEGGSIGKATISTNFGGVTIDQIRGSLKIDKASHGTVLVKNVTRDASLVEIGTNFGGAAVIFESGATIAYDMQSTFGTVNLNGVTAYDTREVKEMNKQSKTGKTGKMGDPIQTTVKIRTGHGNADLTIK